MTADITPWTDTELLPAARTTAERWADWSDAFQKIYKAAEVIARTPLAPKEMIGNTDTVAACMMKGYELGLDPLDSLANMYVVHGRVGFYAEFMRRRILQAGHKIRVVESTDNRCIMEGTRRGESEPQRAQFTAEQARKANLQLGNYPADKLLARATSRLCRQVFPDVLSGDLIVEDMVDGLIPGTDDTEPAPTPTGPQLTRKRRPKPATAASTQPPTQPPKPTTDDVDNLLDDTDGNAAQPADDSVDSDSINPPRRETTASPSLTRVTDDDTLLDEPREPGPGQLPLTAADNDLAELHEATGYPDDEDDGPLITPAQLTKLSILLKEHGFDDREARHDYVTAAIGRPITSAKELTKHEASKVIDTLEN